MERRYAALPQMLANERKLIHLDSQDALALCDAVYVIFEKTGNLTSESRHPSLKDLPEHP